MTPEISAWITQAQCGDSDAADKLLQANSRLIWSIVQRYIGFGAEKEDLFQLGSIGFLRAISAFDLARGTALSSFAVPYIAGEIKRFFRDDGAVKVSRTQKERALCVRRVRARLEQATGHSPRISELSAETGFSSEEVSELLSLSWQTDSLDAPREEGAPPLGELVPAPERETALVERLDLRDALDSLDAQSRMVLILRYLRDFTQQKTGDSLGLTQVQVSRCEKRALLLLRRSLLCEEG